MMNNTDRTKEYVREFFDKLQVYEDVSRGHMYRIFIKQAVLNFLDNESPEKAWDVYRCFFDIYKIAIDGKSDAFTDLLDVLKSYEENAAVLIDRQRDHYVHSVNVFVLGLCIYTKNEKYRRAFDSYALNKNDYKYSYDTKHEEFFYRWGLASLFHDVGYPIEIVGKQINKYISFASDFDGNEDKVKVRLEYEGFDELNRIKKLGSKDFESSYAAAYNDAGMINLMCPLDLLSHRIHIIFRINLEDIKETLDGFVDTMGRFGFIDHGFFSSIIVLKWYGYLIQKAGYRPEYLYWPVLDSALAILLHNCYRNVLQKKPYCMGPLDAKTNPISFLLILCDELQEWNRTAYGIKDKARVLPSGKLLLLENESLDITYITDGRAMPEGFSEEKLGLLRSMLNIDGIFRTSSVKCNQEGNRKSEEAITVIPRPSLAQLEKLAEAIHSLYNEKKLLRNPGEPLKYPDFATLDDSLKYSNLRQAADIFKKAELMGYELMPLDKITEPVRQIPKDMVEAMAEREHGMWIEEKKQQGFVSPYFVPYSELTEEVKQLDRDTIDNIPLLLEKIGLGLCTRS